MHLYTKLNTFAYDWHREFLRFGKWFFNPYFHAINQKRIEGVNNKQINPNHYCRAFSLVHNSGNEILGVE
jgi:hypothetical protein